jgi:gliding motility-associated-like protein
LTVTGKSESPLTTIDTTVCLGPVTLGLQSYSVSGSYNQTFVNSVGCDSVVNYLLTIEQTGVKTTIDTTVCPSVVVSFGGYNFYNSGSYQIIETSSSGCSDTMLLNLNILDTIAPDISSSNPSGCIADTTLYTSVVDCDVVVPDFTSSVQLTITDNCGEITSTDTTIFVTQTPVSGTVIGLGEHIIWIVATDESGNADSCSFILTVEDTIAPSFVGGGCISDTTLYAGPFVCDIKMPDFTTSTQLTIVDNCDTVSSSGIVITQNPPFDTSMSVGTHTVWIIATDSSGNSDSCSFVLTVKDTISPSFEGLNDCISGPFGSPSTIVVNLPSGFTSVPSTGGDFGPFTLNDANCSGVSNFVIAEGGSASYFDVVNTSSSGEFYIHFEPNTSAFKRSGDVTVVNICGLTVSTLTYRFCQPADGCPSDTTLYVDANCDLSVPDFTLSNQINVLDNCGSIVDGISNANITLTQSPLVNDILTAGTYTILMTATDSSGNFGTCTFTLSVLDTIAPIISGPGSNGCLSDTILYAEETLCGVSSPDFVISTNAYQYITDNCGGSDTSLFVLTQNPPVGSILSLGENTVWLIVTDTSGNSDSCSFIVTVIDTIAPSFDGLGDCVVGVVGGSGSISISPLLTSIPATGGTFIFTYNDSLPCNATSPSYIASVSPAGAATATVNTLTNELTLVFAENTTSDKINVTISLVNMCNFTNLQYAFCQSANGCISDTTIYVDDDCDVLVPNFTTSPSLNIYDNCGSVVNGVADANIVSVTQSIIPGTILVAGTYTVVVTATDSSGNIGSCSFNLIVKDTIAPKISSTNPNGCISDTTLYTGITDCEAVVPDFTFDADLTITDNCGDVSSGTIIITQNPEIGTVLLAGTYTGWIIASDTNGNADSCSFIITVKDTVAPTISGPSANGCLPDTVMYTSVDSCGVIIPDFVVESNIYSFVSDNCSADSSLITVLQNPVAGSELTVGTHTVWVIVSDTNGNVDSCSFQLEVKDTIAPTIICPSDTIVSSMLDSCGAVVTWATPIATDNCGSLVDLESDFESGDMFPVGATVVTYTATDTFGNVSTCSFIIKVIDTQKPTILCPSDLSAVPVDSGMCVAFGADLGTPIVSDNCSIMSIVNDAPILLQLGTTAVVWTVSDSAGNTQTCIQLVTTKDTQAPTIICPPDTTVIASNGLCTITGVDLGLPIVTENCTLADVLNNSLVQYGVGTNVVTWTATDESGNSGACTQTIIVLDTIAPTIICPADLTNVSADSGSCEATNVDLGEPVADDNCEIESITNDAPSVLPLGTTIITWTVTDKSGNTATCTQSVTVVDSEAPTFADCPSDIEITTSTGSCDAVVTWIEPTVTDNCSTALTLISTHLSGDVFPIGTTTVTYTATDSLGNQSTCEFVVIVKDLEVPTIVCPSDTLIAVSSGMCTAMNTDLGTPIVSDNCSIMSVENNAPILLPVGTTAVVWTVTDSSGNTQTCTQFITVKDTLAPIITCPADTTLFVDNNSCTVTGVDLGLPVIEENCMLADVMNNALVVYNVGTNVVTWTATDVYGNSSACTQTITVLDTIAPTVVCPSDLTNVSADAGSCEATNVDLGTPIVDDNCEIESITNDAPDTFALGTTIVTWTVTDAGGNVVTCTQSVTVVDSEAPKFADCPSDIEVDAAIGSCDAVVTWIEPTATDNCSSTITQTSSHVSGDVFPVGTTIVTYTATDSSGNESICEFTVTVKDVEKPIIVCPSDTLVAMNSGLCAATNVILDTPVVSDNCLATLTITNDAPIVFNVGTTAVTWTVTDAGGNTASCTQLVTVKDTTAPTIICPSDTTVLTDENCSATGVDLGLPTVIENCTIASITNNAPATYPLGTTVVTWTVTDEAGNVSTCMQSVTVQSPIPFVFDNCPDDITVEALGGTCDVVVNWDAPTASGGCDGVITITNTHNSGDVFSLGETEVTYVATDSWGNIITCTFTVTVTKNGTSQWCDADCDGDGVTNCDEENDQTDPNDPCDFKIESQTVPQTVFCDIVIPEVFSPNGDGKNDYVRIDGLEAYPNTEIWIYDRWGLEVYHSNNYLNDWDGRSQSKLNVGGDELPEGTYYYLLRLGGDDTKPQSGKIFKGFVYIKR